eukprot:TRINITY_DN2308_c0_g2_i2.p1 TRINITY_DN2308_c0_g2~~TRINITY_DN2308_c0_g2_i2.p1  ORF type:complete len:321 (-),score=75.14 TRINITY_DN2308_c0_g2_i2:227-1189(-)
MSSTSECDDVSSAEIEDVEDDLYALEVERHKKAKIKKTCPNDVRGLEQKLAEIQLKIPGYEPNAIPWSETLVLTGSNVVANVLEDPDDDLKREKAFYDQAVSAIEIGLARLKSEGIPYERPGDFYAEMIKSDEQMSKVKGELLRQKREIEEAQARTRQRIKKTASKKVQQQTKQMRKAQRQEDQAVIKKWRKSRSASEGDREFPVDLLDSNTQLHREYSKGATSPNKSPRTFGKPSAKALAKQAKYGGVKKRGMKRNTADSSNDFSSFKFSKNKKIDSEFLPKGMHLGNKGKMGTGGANRPGKRKRQSQPKGPRPKRQRR